MAEYLIQDTTLTAIGDAIRAKTETTDLIPVPDIPGKIAAIETGITVQKATGTFKTSNGSATVNCGFQPDAVNIYFSTDSDGDDLELSVIFSESANPKYVAAYSNEGEYCNGFCTIKRTTTGFSISGLNWYTDDWEQWTSTNETYNYTAIKYT